MSILTFIHFASVEWSVIHKVLVAHCSWHHHNMLQCSQRSSFNFQMRRMPRIYYNVCTCTMHYICAFYYIFEFFVWRWIFHWVKNLNTIDALGCAYTCIFDAMCTLCIIFINFFPFVSSFCFICFVFLFSMSMTHAVYTI